MLFGFELYAECVITKKELVGLVTPLFTCNNPSAFAEDEQIINDPDLPGFIQGKLDDFLNTFERIVASREAKRRQTGWFFKSSSKQNNTKHKKFGHSYMETIKPRIKKKEFEVVNRTLISVAHGSEDTSFRIFRKNQYEDALFKCEDEMYELDMKIDRTKYLNKELASVDETVEQLSSEEKEQFQLDTRLMTPFRLQLIERIYCDYAPRLIKMLEQKPYKAIPIVNTRLSSQITDWQSVKPEKVKSWTETIDKNFYKSLDHRSFYFKQNEKRLTNTRNFIAEASKRAVLANRNKALRLASGMNVESYECIGGSMKMRFFNSFQGLSTCEAPHNLPQGFSDRILEELLEKGGRPPQFRMLMNDKEIIQDAVCLLCNSIESSNVTDKNKVRRELVKLFQEFMQVDLPSEVLSDSIQPYFEKGYKRTILEKTRTEVKASKNSMISLRTDEQFAEFLPLLKNDKVYYSPPSVYNFIRFFYCLYERLVKAKHQLDASSYKSFLKFICTVEPSKLEEQVSGYIQKDAYIYFTMDKLISSAFKALQTIANEDLTRKSFVLFQEFASKMVNEEMYFARSTHLAFSSPVFRLHWEPQWGIFSVSISESPVGKLQEGLVPNPQQYKSNLITKNTQSNLSKELEILFGKLDTHYRNAQVTIQEFENAVFFKQAVVEGIVENSYKLRFQPGQEDFLFNKNFYAQLCVVDTGTKRYKAHDKNSLIQLVLENSQKKFKASIINK